MPHSLLSLCLSFVVGAVVPLAFTVLMLRAFPGGPLSRFLALLMAAVLVSMFGTFGAAQPFMEPVGGFDFSDRMSQSFVLGAASGLMVPLLVDFAWQLGKSVFRKPPAEPK